LIFNKIKDKKHFLILSYYLVIIFFYYYTERTIEPKYYVYLTFDKHIPFIKEMVIPYILWYFYIGASLLYLGLNSREDFLKLCALMFVGMTICFILYLQFPNGHTLRPRIKDDDIFSKLVKAIYNLDTPTNSAPSIHVLVSISIHISIIKSNYIKNKVYIKIASLITMLSIVASTVLIKQHSILDVFFGIALSIVVYFAVYKLKIFRTFKIGKRILTSEDKSM